MADYAYKTRTPTDRSRSSDIRVRHSVPSTVALQPHRTGRSLQAAVSRGARTGAIAQLRRTLQQSPPVTELASISAMLQWARRPPTGTLLQRVAIVKDDPTKLKVNDQHKATVNDWFAANIDVDDRTWDDA